MNRITTPDGLIPQPNGPPRPPTMEQRIQTALEHWQFKRKDLGFATALNCIAYLSSGLAAMAKITNQLEQENDARKKEVAELKAKLDSQLNRKTDGS